MDTYESLSHSKWECKYHVVFIPKCRRRVLYGQLRRYLGEVFHRLAQQKECRIEEGHLMPDHVHMLILIPPKYAVSQVVGFIKGKSAIHIARVYGERKRNFVGQHFLMTRRLDCRLTIWSNSHSRSGCKGSNSTAWANISQTGGMRQVETVGGSSPVSAESQQRPVERWARNVRFGSIADIHGSTVVPSSQPRRVSLFQKPKPFPERADDP